MTIYSSLDYQAGIPVPAQKPEDPGTPATVVERIQKSIGDSAEGWRIGFAYVAGKGQQALQVLKREHEETVIGLSYGAYLAGEKATEAVAGAQKGISGVGSRMATATSKIGESFSNLGGTIKSAKWGFYIVIPIIIFIAIMVAIGYSGVGGPTARIAEREYSRRR